MSKSLTQILYAEDEADIRTIEQKLQISKLLDQVKLSASKATVAR